MKKISIPVVALAAATLCASISHAENKAETFVLSPFVGGYVFDGVQEISHRSMLGLKLGYNFTDRLGLEGVVEGGRSQSNLDSNNKIKFMNYRLEALYHMFPESRIVPYLAVGYGGMQVKGDTERLESGFLDYGLGVKFALSESVAIRADLRNLVIDCGPTIYNYEYTLGLGFSLGAEKPAPPAAVVAPPVPAPASKLSVSPESVVKGQAASLSWTSQDTTACSIQPGIGAVPTSGSMSVTPDTTSNYLLTCTGQGGTTSSNASLSVAQPAAPPLLDTDKDGVPDNMDKCPDTPLGVKVDLDGCPLDADKDGVADYLDKCPGTPLGVVVDQYGCPLDADKDGVADYLDKCPETPLEVKVDPNGCPTDTDKDGVADYLDKCPNTPAGDKVDQLGCSLPVEQPCQNVRLDMEFDTNKADIKSAYHDELKKVGDMLNKYPRSTAQIEGHTDNVGNAAANMKLSDRRANSVREYIIDKFGIQADRITAKGYGLTKPIATNKTEAGRKLNRRVEAVLNCSN